MNNGNHRNYEHTFAHQNVTCCKIQLLPINALDLPRTSSRRRAAVQASHKFAASLLGVNGSINETMNIVDVSTFYQVWTDFMTYYYLRNKFFN